LSKIGLTKQGRSDYFISKMVDIFPHSRKWRPPATGAALSLLFLLSTACQHPGLPGVEDGSALNLRSSPSNAVITLDGKATDLRTPTLLTSLSPGEHRLRISRAGYRDWEKFILIKPGQTLNLNIRLQPTTTGVFSISSIPFQCRIFVDGRPIPLMTPATLTNLPVGTHTITLRREGYEDWSHAVVILQNRHLHLKASLKPTGELTGHLRLQSHPHGAEIIIDGYPTGNRTPATIYNLQAGAHRLLLTKEGYNDWTEEIVLREGETENLLLTLRRVESHLSGSAAIHTTPPGAQAILNEVTLGSPTPVVLESVTRGTHSLRIEMDGYRPWEGELVVNAGEKTEIAVTLEPRQ
jgi:hypothetical protein